MSHVELVEFEFDGDFDALRCAIETLGGELMFNQKTHAWWGTYIGDSAGMRNNAADAGRDPETFGKCLHAIRKAGSVGRNGPGGPWEIGLVQSENGKWGFVYDNYGGAGRLLEQQFGRDAVRIKDEYAAEVATRELQRDGWRVTRTVEQDGTIVLDAA